MTQDNSTQPIGLRSLPRKQVLITFGGVMLAMFLGALDQTVVGTAMPRIISDLGGFSQYTWVTSVYIISSAVVVPITGKLTDIYGRKIFYIGGLIIFMLASILCGLSSTMNQIIIFRALQGIGAGVIMANAFIVIGDLFPPAERGKYQGFIAAVFGVSSIVGPTLGGYITDTLSWHWVFFVNVPLGLIVILLFIFFFPNFRPDNLKHSVDYPGVVLLILGVVPLMLALSWGGVEYAWGSGQIIGMFVFSVVALALLIWVESRSKEPIIPLAIFKDRIVAISSVLIFLTSAGMFGTIIFIPLFFQGVLGESATSSGSFITPMMLGVVFGSAISGQVLSRTGGHYRLQGVVGLALMAIGMWLLSRMNVDTTNATAIAYMVTTGFGLGITMPLYMLAVQNTVPYKLLGAATSSTAFFRSIGGSVGLAIFGSVMNNKFAAELLTRLPADFVAKVPQQQIDAIMNNPQILMDPQAQAQLQEIIGGMGDQSSAILQDVTQGLRDSLSISISQVFLYALVAIIVAFVVNLFIKEIPLRQHHDVGTDYTAKKEE
ncbi:MAG: MFS transporter [Chloroflexi bacterium RBG_13_51_18]|nr:MAG: MFS transporter [Chloroflexi bacterium RBG_13_51_18]